MSSRERTKTGQSKLVTVGFVVAGLIFLALILPFVVGMFRVDQLKFHQFYIEEIKKDYHSATVSDRIKYWFSSYTLALNYLLNNPSPINKVRLDDPDSVFQYVYSRLPYYAIVHPSEMYYYYSFKKGNQTISGNLRLVEAGQGRVGLGYFDASDGNLYDHKIFGIVDGLVIQKKTNFLYQATYQGKTVYFDINDSIFDHPSTLKLVPEEQFVTRVEDESGLAFFLFFNYNEKYFSYVLDETRPIVDTLIPIDDGKIMVGKRSRFAFYNDTALNRKILFGVSASGVEANDYFDGPFDQVYPFLNIKEKIYRVYPYTQLAGIDNHGNFLHAEGVRVAISPYYKYQDLAELTEILGHCEVKAKTPTELYSCLTYDEKRDFHLSSPNFNADGTLKRAIKSL